MIPDSLTNYFNQPVRVLRFELRRVVWLALAALAVVVLAGTAILGVQIFNAGWNSEVVRVLFWIGLGCGAILLVAILAVLVYVLLPGTRVFGLLTLVFSAAAFIVDKYLLEHQVFAPFTDRTVIALWLCFAALGLALFYRRLPAGLLATLPAVLAVGLCLCIGFIVIMAPLMLIGWIAIPFGGLGLLPYSPLMAAVAFGLMARRVDGELKERRERSSGGDVDDEAHADGEAATQGAVEARRAVVEPVRAPGPSIDAARLPGFWLLFSRGLLLVTLTGLLVYVSWFVRQWYRVAELVERYTEYSLRVGPRDGTLQHLPGWARLAMLLPDNHAVEIFLQPNDTRGFRVFETGKVFDPLAFLVSLGAPPLKLSDSERVQLLRLLFDRSHVDLQRLWGGDTLMTTDVKTRVQLYPASRLAYTETTLAVYNEGSTRQEAIFTLTAPEGSVASQLSLWIGGREEPARLALKSTAERAYRAVVGVERRDPALLTWMDGGRLRLRVFPVMGGNYRTFKVGIISPLIEKDGRLEYRAVKLEGPPTLYAQHERQVDSFDAQGRASTVEEGSGGILGRLAAMLGRGLAPAGDFSIPAPREVGGSFDFDGARFRMTAPVRQEVLFQPERIYLVLSQALGRDDWQELYDRLRNARPYGARVFLAGTKIVEAEDRATAEHFLATQPLPRFNPFPFYDVPLDETALVVDVGREHSLPLGGYRDSAFFQRSQQYFARRRTPLYVASAGGGHAAFYRGLAEFDRLQLLDLDPPALEVALRSRSLLVPRSDATHLPFRAMNVTMRVDPAAAPPGAVRGNDLLGRLFLYRSLMRRLGARYFADDRAQADLLGLARDGMLVSPISSLIVLETERDYERFGIKKGGSALGQSQLKNEDGSVLAAAGGVPEPEEWALLILVLAMLAYFYRARFQTLFERLRARPVRVS